MLRILRKPLTRRRSATRRMKGGESGMTMCLAAVMNAVVDALSPYGIEHLDMPATPGKDVGRDSGIKLTTTTINWAKYPDRFLIRQSVPATPST